MDPKIKNIISSLVLLAAFFMPWVKIMGIGGSAFDLIKEIFKNIKHVEKEPMILSTLLLLLFPLCVFIILINYSKNEINPTQIASIQFAKKTPLVLIIITILYMIITFSKDLKYLKGKDLSSLIDIVSIGLILTLISSIILFFDETKGSVSKPDQPSGEPKEVVDMDDIFK